MGGNNYLEEQEKAVPLAEDPNILEEEDDESFEDDEFDEEVYDEYEHELYRRETGVFYN